MEGDVVIAKEPVELEATVVPRDKDNTPATCSSPKKKEKKKEDDRANCDSCRILRETATPVVHCVNMTQTDVFFDRRLIVYKISDGNPEDDPPIVPERLVDRFEEARYWDVIGLNHKWYEKLKVSLKKVSPKRLVFRKCVYRLHNTRHFAIPLDKKAGKKEDVLKQAYEDDKKLIKRNQAFECPWDECVHSFRDPQDMRIHYMFDHESVKLFCCGQRYDNYDRFLEHIVSTPKEKRHATWSARECWGCLQRFVDTEIFYAHTDSCAAQIYPYACPDPLCPMKYDNMRDSVEHFFLYHSLQSAGSISFNNIIYRTLAEMLPDLTLIDEGQLSIAFNMKAVYFCNRCNTQFACEKYYLEHALNHKNQPCTWLVYNFLFCFLCNRPNCGVQRGRLLEVIPKLLKMARTVTIEQCKKNPLLLIWHIFLTNDFIQMMNLLHARLLYEQTLQDELKEEPSETDLNHPPCADSQIAAAIDSLIFLFTTRYPPLSENPHKMITGGKCCSAQPPASNN